MTEALAGEAASEDVSWPAIPDVAWRRGIGVPCPSVGRPRVHTPMIDDGEWAGIPIGGLGTGSIGRTFRGDAARWHLEVGRHRFEPVAADGFALFVGRPDGSSSATVLGVRPPTDDLPGWGWDLPVGGGTYHALFPRAWQTFEPDALGVRLTGEQLSPVIAGDLERSALPVGVFEWWIENPGPEPLTVGLLATWADPPGGPDDGPAPGRPHTVVIDGASVMGVRFGDAADTAPVALRGTLAFAALADDDWELSARATFDPLADTETWIDFASDGRLDAASPARADAPTAGPAGAALAATTSLGPGERRSVRFALAWDLPRVEFGAGRQWWKRYTRDWGRSGTCAWELATHALRETPAWRRAIEAWQRADPRRPRAAGVVSRGPLQRAVLPRRRRDLLGGRRGGRSPARSGRPRPVRAAGMRRLPVLRHGRRRLLRVVRAARAVPRARAARHP